MTKLAVAPDLKLPLEAVTQTFAFLAKRGAGKTYTAGVLVEEMLKARQHVVIVDPLDVWWGLRASADGKSEGLPITVFGGQRADLPLAVDDGELIARLIVEERVSAVLSLRHFRKAERTRFLTPFYEILYHLNRDPLHLVLDEADASAPQRPQKGQERMLGAVEDIVRRGRSAGLGVSLVSQRSAVLNKDVLTQVEVLVALRTIAPQDVDAIDSWIRQHGTAEQRKEILSSLPMLPIGDSWWWSPAWLEVFLRTRVRKKETYDSSRTPKPGETLRKPKKLAAVDLEKIRERLTKTIERAKQDDPKELRKQIAELTSRIRSMEKAAPAKPVEDRAAVREQAATINRLKKALEAAMKFIINVSTQNFDVAGVDKAELERAIGTAVVRATELVDKRLETRARSIERLKASAQQLATSLKAALKDEDVVITVDVQKNEPFTVRPAPVPMPKRTAAEKAVSGNGDREFTGSHQRVLNAISWLNHAGIAWPTPVQIALVYGASHTTGTFKQYLRDSVELGYAVRESGRLQLTAEGTAVADAGDFRGSTLDRWLEKLPGAQSKMLETIVARAPITREDLAQVLGKSHTTGTFKQDIRDLRSYGLVSLEQGVLQATELVA